MVFGFLAALAVKAGAAVVSFVAPKVAVATAAAAGMVGRFVASKVGQAVVPVTKFVAEGAAKGVGHALVSQLITLRALTGVGNSTMCLAPEPFLLNLGGSGLDLAAWTTNSSVGTRSSGLELELPPTIDNISYKLLCTELKTDCKLAVDYSRRCSGNNGEYAFLTHAYASGLNIEDYDVVNKQRIIKSVTKLAGSRFFDLIDVDSLSDMFKLYYRVSSWPFELQLGGTTCCVTYDAQIGAFRSVEPYQK